MTRTYVIAEVGSCHNLDIRLAERCIADAAGAGADAVKFQWTSDPVKMAARRHIDDPETYRRLAFPAWWHQKLAQAARFHGIDYMCTVYLHDDIKTVAPYVVRFKVSSFEAPDWVFVAAHMGYDKPIIVSLGMGQSIHVPAIPGVAYLHCVSSYPTPIEQLNLARIRTESLDGLSDHTVSLQTGGLAVITGARIIEKHLRLSCTLENDADYAHSLLPQAFKFYVNYMRQAERALGDGSTVMQECERENVRYRVEGT